MPLHTGVTDFSVRIKLKLWYGGINTLIVKTGHNGQIAGGRYFELTVCEEFLWKVYTPEVTLNLILSIYCQKVKTL